MKQTLSRLLRLGLTVGSLASLTACQENPSSSNAPYAKGPVKELQSDAKELTSGTNASRIEGEGVHFGPIPEAEGNTKLEKIQ